MPEVRQGPEDLLWNENSPNLPRYSHREYLCKWPNETSQGATLGSNTRISGYTSHHFVLANFRSKHSSPCILSALSFTTIKKCHRFIKARAECFRSSFTYMGVESRVPHTRSCFIFYGTSCFLADATPPTSCNRGICEIPKTPPDDAGGTTFSQ